MHRSRKALLETRASLLHNHPIDISSSSGKSFNFYELSLVFVLWGLLILFSLWISYTGANLFLFMFLFCIIMYQA